MTEKFTYEYVKYFIEIESNSGCKLLSQEYKNSKTKLLLQCYCGNKFYIRFNEFNTRNQRRCQKCSREISKTKLLKTNEEFKKEVCNLVGNEYTVLDEYKGALNKINIRHNKCGNIWNTSPANLLNRGSRCPYCYRSKGEERVALYLDNNNIKYEEQYIFDDCKYINPLPFDFYLQKCNLLIEYDGEQHFKPINFGGMSDEESKLKYREIKKNDIIKNQYCINNNISLLRIPYWEFGNIEVILKEWLHKYKNIKENNYGD